MGLEMKLKATCSKCGELFDEPREQLHILGSSKPRICPDCLEKDKNEGKAKQEAVRKVPKLPKRK